MSVNPTKSVNRNFNAATTIALRSQMSEKHGAVLVRGGKIVGKGFNSGSPMRMFGDKGNFGCYMHAEMAAIREFQNAQRKKHYKQSKSKKYFERHYVLRGGSVCRSSKSIQRWIHSHGRIKTM